MSYSYSSRKTFPCYSFVSISPTGSYSHAPHERIRAAAKVCQPGMLLLNKLNCKTYYNKHKKPQHCCYGFLYYFLLLPLTLMHHTKGFVRQPGASGLLSFYFLLLSLTQFATKLQTSQSRAFLQPSTVFFKKSRSGSFKDVFITRHEAICFLSRIIIYNML